MAQTRKISVSLASAVVDDLDFVSDRMGVSRSALMSQFLGEALSETRKVLELIPKGPTPAEIIRMRGESEDKVRARMANLQGMVDDLFSK